jgi:hypothetical protein
MGRIMDALLTFLEDVTLLLPMSALSYAKDWMRPMFLGGADLLKHTKA